MTTASPSLDNASLNAQAAQQHALPSPSLSNSKTSSTPSLPPEIIHRIIQLAFPRLSVTTYRERYDTLLRFGRVNSTWHAFAQRELYRHVVLPSSTAVDMLHVVLRANSSCAAVVRSVSVVCSHNAWSGGLEAVYDVLQLSTWVKEIWMFESVSVGLDLVALSRSAPRLEVLCIDHYRYTYLPTTEQPSFPRLHTLAASIAGPTSLLGFMLTLPMPQLRHLFITPFQLGSTQLQNDLGSVIKQLGPQLETFALTDVPTGTLATLDSWTSMTSLKTLVVSERLPSGATTIKFVPPTVKHLRLPQNFVEDGDDMSGTDGRISFVKGCLTGASEHVETLSLTPLDAFRSYDEVARCDAEDEDWQRKDIEQVCARQSITLSWGESAGFCEFPRYWEYIVAGGPELSRSR